MTKKKKILVGVLGSLLAIILFGLAVMYYLLVKGFPETNGEIVLSGLHNPVTVYRDRNGIPHIMAENEDDLYFAQGFVTAQDRFFQMDIARRYGQGRLAEVVGSVARPLDVLMRTIGISDLADSLFPRLDSLSRRFLRAYANGVNAYLAHNAGALPVEFDVLQYTPEPWRPQHSVIISRLMGWELNLSWWLDPVFSDIVARLGPEKAFKIFPGLPADLVKPAVAPAVLSQTMKPISEAVDGLRKVFGATGASFGSNAWVISGSRSDAGASILANDTHLLLMQPARWYIVHMNAPGINVAGFSIPGAPGVVIGHNNDIAWGMTNLMNDDADFYVEHVFPDSTYEFKGKRLRLSVRLDTILVKDSLPYPLVIRRTGHGPLISSVYSSDYLAGRKPRATALSLKWTGYEFSNEFLAFYRVNRARTWEEFTAALRTFGLPAQNFVFTDRAGNIGLISAGNLPRRSTRTALFPTPGWTGTNEWRGRVPFERLPRVFNPDRGFIASANYKPEPEPPYFISDLWEPPSRVRRIEELLSNLPALTVRDFQIFQQDQYSRFATEVTPYIVDAVFTQKNRSVPATRAMNILARWDGKMYPGSNAAAIFNVTVQHILKRTLLDELGPRLLYQYLFLPTFALRSLPRLLSDTTTTWFDDTRTATIETRDDILRRSFALALNDLLDRFGPDMDRWKWGKLHTLTMKHPLGEVAALAPVLNIGPLETGGHGTTVNNGSYSLNEPYNMTIGPSMRFIIDMSSPDSCMVILPTGQSGHPMHEHYADQTNLWLDGVYITLESNPDSVRRRGWDKLVLQTE